MSTDVHTIESRYNTSTMAFGRDSRRVRRRARWNARSFHNSKQINLINDVGSLDTNTAKVCAHAMRTRKRLPAHRLSDKCSLELEHSERAIRACTCVVICVLCATCGYRIVTGSSVLLCANMRIIRLCTNYKPMHFSHTDARARTPARLKTWRHRVGTSRCRVLYAEKCDKC